MPRSPDSLRRGARILARALVYAGAVTLLALYAPGAAHVFIYQGF
jgi:hypothetical protein